MGRVGCNAKKIMVPKIVVTGLSDYARSASYRMDPIARKFETKTLGCGRSIKLLADIIDVEELPPARRLRAPSFTPDRLTLLITRLRRPRLAVILVRGVDEAFHVLEVFIVVAPT